MKSTSPGRFSNSCARARLRVKPFMMPAAAPVSARSFTISFTVKMFGWPPTKMVILSSLTMSSLSAAELLA